METLGLPAFCFILLTLFMRPGPDQEKRGRKKKEFQTSSNTVDSAKASVPSEIIDLRGRKLTISFNKNGTLSFPPNASADLVLLASNMAKTKIGLHMLQLVQASKTETSFQIDTITVKKSSTGNTLGAETTPIISTPVDRYGRPIGEQYILKASIVIYEAAIKQTAANNKGNIAIDNVVIETSQFPLADILASYAIHECTHVIDRKFTGSFNPKATKSEIERKPYENQLQHLIELKALKNTR